MLGPELAMVETHLRVSDSGLENGCGCSAPIQQSVAIALSQPKHPEGGSPRDLILQLSKPWFPHLGFEPRSVQAGGSRYEAGLGCTQHALTVIPDR